MMASTRRALVGTAASAWASVMVGRWAPDAAAAPTHRPSTQTVPFELYVVGIPINATTVKLIQGFIDETFNQRHKGVHAIYTPAAPATTDAAAILAGGTFPWVLARCCGDWPILLPLLQPLNDYFRQDNIKTSVWPPKLVAQLVVDGKLYGVPVDAAGQAYIYRQDILEEMGLPYPDPDWNYTEAARLWRSLTRTGAGQQRAGATLPWQPGGPFPGLALLTGFGGAYLDTTATHCLLDLPASIACGEWVFGLLWDGVCTAGDGYPAPGLATGQVIFSQGADPSLLWAVQNLGTKVKWDFIPYPRWPVHAATVGQSSWYAIAAAAPHKEIAWEIFKFAAVDTEWSRFYMRLALAPPAQLPLLGEWEAIVRAAAPILRTKALRYWREPAEKGEAYPGFEYFRYNAAQASAVVSSTWGRIWNKQLGVAEGFKEIARQVNAVVAAGRQTAAAAGGVVAAETRALRVAPGPQVQYPAPIRQGAGVMGRPAPWLRRRPPAAYTLLGDGAALSGNSNNLVFAGHPVTATEGEWTVRLTAITDVSCQMDGIGLVDGWARAGIMAVSDLSSNPAFVALAVTAGGKVSWELRASPLLPAAGTDALLSVPAGIRPSPLALSGIAAAPPQTALRQNLLLAPIWLRLRRVGPLWWGFTSADGRHWQAVGPPHSVEMAGCWLGFFAYARNNTLGGKGYIRADLDGADFSPTIAVQVGTAGVPPSAGAVPSDWARAALPAAVVTLPPGVRLGAMLAPGQAMTALFAREPVARAAWLLASAVYAARPDLQHAFPAGRPGYRRAYLQWLTTVGTGAAGGLDPWSPYLWPWRSAFATLKSAT